jgi:pimeloyl-ACP methyl ester carboxylesterase
MKCISHIKTTDNSKMPNYSSRTVRGVRLEALELGSGRTLLFLHAGYGLDFEAASLERLGAQARVIAPTHPGFGSSERPSSVTTVDDVAYLYLDLLQELDLRDVTVVGVSLGAWIAAEMAVKSTQRLANLVLSNTVGIKVNGRETRDIADIFAMTEDEFKAAAFADPAVGARDFKSMPEAQVLRAAQNREAVARFTWSPYMHNPKLRSRLHRVNVPTLFLWGAQDRIVSQDYGRAYCAAVPDARFELIEAAGHFPHIEQPQAFATRVLNFMEDMERAKG